MQRLDRETTSHLTSLEVAGGDIQLVRFKHHFGLDIQAVHTRVDGKRVRDHAFLMLAPPRCETCGACSARRSPQQRSRLLISRRGPSGGRQHDESPLFAAARPRSPHRMEQRQHRANHSADCMFWLRKDRAVMQRVRPYGMDMCRGMAATRRIKRREPMPAGKADRLRRLLTAPSGGA
jgi:hypothetical protein